MNTASSSEDEDPLRESRAYNQSIYLMVAMPYVLLGTVGLLIYRGVKAARQSTQAGLLSQLTEEPRNLPHDAPQPPSDPAWREQNRLP